MKSIQKTARLAGFYYLLVAICGFYGIMYVPSQIMAKGNVVATMQNILTKELLFRSGITVNLLGSVAFMLTALTFYQLFKNIDDRKARWMLALVLVQIPINFVAESFVIASIMIAKGEILKNLSLIEQQNWVMFFLRLKSYTIVVLMIFWGLWLIPLGQLILKSGYLPKWIGILLVLGGIAYTIESIDFILLSERLSFITDYGFIFYSTAELSTVAWLLVKGVRMKTT
ncbi:MAG: DUF4386 domain-containing protein [Arcicella sp.]|nr:DUF4386 domain-containing protein [Arcicella sp.]